ncbi:DUF2461 family protein [Pseudonocardia saturnea]
MFTGWTPDAPAFLAEVAADHSSFEAERHRASVLAPMQALAAELAPEFGELRVFRPYRNRRFRPDAPPYRTDTGGTARGGTLGVVLSATALSATAGAWLSTPGSCGATGQPSTTSWPVCSTAWRSTPPGG